MIFIFIPTLSGGSNPSASSTIDADLEEMFTVTLSQSKCDLKLNCQSSNTCLLSLRNEMKPELSQRNAMKLDLPAPYIAQKVKSFRKDSLVKYP